MTIFSFPPDKGNVGTAAYLDVFGSIYAVLSKLGKEVRTLHLSPAFFRRGYRPTSPNLSRYHMPSIELSAGSGARAVTSCRIWR